MPGRSSPRSDEADSASGHVDVPKAAPLTDAASSDDLVGAAQPDVQHQQETWVKYTALQEAQMLPEWRQQDSLLAQATVGFGKPHSGHVQQIDLAQPLSASLKIMQAPAAYNRPIVQKKLFKPPFVVRLQLQYQGQIDVLVTMMAHVLNDSQCSKPGAWQPHVGPGQADLEGHLITRRLQVPSAFTAQQQSHMEGPAAHRVLEEDFEFTELNFVKSSRMSKRWLLFTCFIKDELIYVLYKLPTVVISRRTDQYSKAYENLMGQVPQQGIPKARANALPRAPSGTAASQIPSALQLLHQYRKSTEPREPFLSAPLPGPLPLNDPHDSHKRSREASVQAELPSGGNESQWNVSQAGQQIAGWILQQYASLGFRRALTQADVAALESRVKAGAASPALDPRSWEDFQSWFSKTTKALKQCEEEWNQTDPPCMAGFAMDRSSADAALRYEPQGAFLVRMCPEPGCYAISCRTSNDSQSVDQAASADGFASSEGTRPAEHRLVDCVDLQRRSLWHHVLSWGAATHLLDPSSYRLYPKNQVHSRLAASQGGEPAAPAPEAIYVDQLLSLAAQVQSHNAAGLSSAMHPGNAKHASDPNANTLTLPGIPYPTSAPLYNSSIEDGHAKHGSAGSAAQQAWTEAPANGGDGNLPEINPRMQALLASLQAQGVGPQLSAHQAASPAREEAEEEQRPTQHQLQRQEQQVAIEQASGGLERRLQHPADVADALSSQRPALPDSVNAVLQQLLQQSRAPRPWQVDEGSEYAQNQEYSQKRRDSISE